MTDYNTMAEINDTMIAIVYIYRAPKFSFILWTIDNGMWMPMA